MSLKLELLKDALLLMAVDEFLRITEPKKEPQVITGRMVWEGFRAQGDTYFDKWEDVRTTQQENYEKVAQYLNKRLQTV